MCNVAAFYGRQLERYSFPEPHPLNTRRLSTFYELLKEGSLLGDPRVRVVEPVMAGEDIVRLFHDPNYIEFVRKASQLGYGYLDYGDTPAFKGVFEASLYSVGSTIASVDLVMKGDFDHAFNPVGGLHHAKPESAAGFCVFNDASIAVSYLTSKVGLNRILYVDIDAHHGDGVYYPFAKDRRVFMADIHEDGRHLFPGTGFDHERGEGDAYGTKLNISLKPGAGDEEFLDAFSKVEAFAEEAEPEFILFQCGADCLQGDPITHLQYTMVAHRHAATRLHSYAHLYCKGRLVAMGGGGYNPRNTAEAWIEVLRSLLEIADRS